MILYTVKTVLLLLVSLVALLAPLLIDAHHRWSFKRNKRRIWAASRMPLSRRLHLMKQAHSSCA